MNIHILYHCFCLKSDSITITIVFFSFIHARLNAWWLLWVKTLPTNLLHALLHIHPMQASVVSASELRQSALFTCFPFRGGWARSPDKHFWQQPWLFFFFHGLFLSSVFFFSPVSCSGSKDFPLCQIISFLKCSSMPPWWVRFLPSLHVTGKNVYRPSNFVQQFMNRWDRS